MYTYIDIYHHNEHGIYIHAYIYHYCIHFEYTFEY